MYPIASIAKGGGRIVAGSDWMATSMNPLDSIQAAVTRRGGQRVSLAAILAAYTRDAAWAAREDATDGTLASGKAADLIVLDRNLFKLAPASLNKARVLLTLLDGLVVWRDPSFSWR
jgi:predicted amidohydrolase YtcJ